MLSKYWYKQTSIYLCQKIIRTVEEPHSKEDKQANRQKKTAEERKKQSYSQSYNTEEKHNSKHN